MVTTRFFFGNERFSIGWRCFPFGTDSIPLGMDSIPTVNEVVFRGFYDKSSDLNGEPRGNFVTAFAARSSICMQRFRDDKFEGVFRHRG